MQARNEWEFEDCPVRRMVSPIWKLKKQKKITIEENIRNESKRKKAKGRNVKCKTTCTVKERGRNL
jgi:hypothetical protein